MSAEYLCFHAGSPTTVSDSELIRFYTSTQTVEDAHENKQEKARTESYKRLRCKDTADLCLKSLLCLSPGCTVVDLYKQFSSDIANL